MNKELIELLEKHKLRATPQRLKILTLLKSGGHLTVDDLYAQLKEHFPSLSLATVYKNINAMLEKGLVFELKLKGRKDHYELVKEHHSHVICESCGKIKDLDLPLLIQADMAKKITNYNINSATATLYGTCPDCLKDK